MALKKVHKRSAPHGSDHQYEARAVGFLPEHPAFGNPADRPVHKNEARAIGFVPEHPAFGNPADRPVHKNEARAVGFVPEDPAFGNPTNRPSSATHSVSSTSSATGESSTTSSAASSSSSSAASSSSSSSSSESSVETSASSTPPVGAPTPPPVDTSTSVPQYEAPTTRTTPTGNLSINNRSSTSSSATSSATNTSAPDDSSNVGSMAGMAAAGIAAVAVVAVLLIWWIRRRQRAKENAEVDAAAVFSRDSFMRHSTMIPDEPNTGGLPPPRRGPEMIDRSFTSTPVSTYGGMGSYAAPQSEFGYATQPSFQPGSVIFTPTSPNMSFGPGGAPATPLPNSPGFTPGFDGQMSQANGYTELTRGSPMSPPPFTPGQQQTYDEIPRQMTPGIPPVAPAGVPSKPSSPAPTDPYGRVPAYPELSPVNAAQRGQVTEVNNSAYEVQANSAQYGFAGARPDAQAQTAKRGAPADAVYDEDDAYGGM